MDQKNQKTPTTNRGVINTLEPSKLVDIIGQTNDLQQFILFDWFQATILDLNFEILSETGEFIGYTDLKGYAYQFFQNFFGISSNDLFFEYKGLNGYNARLTYMNIQIMWNTSRPDMGLHIFMSGQGCRDFEQLGLSFFDLIKTISQYRVNFNRIDISIDDFSGKFFTMNKILDYCKTGMVSTSFIHCLDIQKLKLKDGSNQGHTIQFGSKASQVQITFYNKLQERASKNVIVHNDIKFWIRCEVRFRHERADQLAKMLCKDQNLNQIVKGILYKYLDFKTKNSNDSNISRRPTVKWWSDFLENIDKLSFSKLLPEHSITKKINWMNSTCSKSNLMVILSQLDNVSCDDKSVDFIYNMIQKGVDEINPKDLQMINDYRISKKMVPLSQTQILNFVDDIRGVILLTSQDFLD